MKKVKVVIIDDEKETCKLMKKALENSGPYTVSTAYNAAQGQILCLQETPQLIILDYVLPDGITGDRIIDLLRKDPQLNKVPVILISGLGEMKYIEKEDRWVWAPEIKSIPQDVPPVLKWHRTSEEVAQTMGAVYYLRKPFSKDRLVKVADYVLEQKSKEEL